MTDFSSFDHGATYYLSLRALNVDGIASAPQVFEYQTAPLKLEAWTLDRPLSRVTLSWASLPGKSYQAKGSGNLTDWTTLATHTAAPGEWTMTRVLEHPGLDTLPRAFWRVVVAP